MTHNLTTDDNKIIKFATLARLQAQNARQCSIYDNSPHDTQLFLPCAYLTARKGTKPIRLPAIQRKGTYDSRKWLLEWGRFARTWYAFQDVERLHCDTRHTELQISTNKCKTLFDICYIERVVPDNKQGADKNEHVTRSSETALLKKLR